MPFGWMNEDDQQRRDRERREQLDQADRDRRQELQNQACQPQPIGPWPYQVYGAAQSAWPYGK
jgi:hypothetical protein